MLLIPKRVIMGIVIASWLEVSLLFIIPPNIFLAGLLFIHISNMVLKGREG